MESDMIRAWQAMEVDRSEIGARAALEAFGQTHLDRLGMVLLLGRLARVLPTYRWTDAVSDRASNLG